MSILQWSRIIAAKFTSDKPENVEIRNKIHDIKALVRNNSASTQLYPGVNVKSNKDAAGYEFLDDYDQQGKKPRRGTLFVTDKYKKGKLTYR